MLTAWYSPFKLNRCKVLFALFTQCVAAGSGEANSRVQTISLKRNYTLS
jgi:hypothetical protein